jgi:phage terminase small subunit
MYTFNKQTGIIMKHIEAKTVTVSKWAISEAIKLAKEFGLQPASYRAKKNYCVVRDAAGEMVATVSTRVNQKALISINVAEH